MMTVVNFPGAVVPSELAAMRMASADVTARPLGTIQKMIDELRAGLLPLLLTATVAVTEPPLMTELVASLSVPTTRSAVCCAPETVLSDPSARSVAVTRVASLIFVKVIPPVVRLQCQASPGVSR